MSQLCSLTLHLEQHPDNEIDTLYLEASRDVLCCMQALRYGTTIKRLEIHLYLRNPSKNSWDGGTPCNDPVSLALFLSGNHMRNCCQELEQALLADRAVHLTIITHLPSFWTHREVVLRSLREDAFPNLHSKDLLTVGYSGGTFVLLFRIYAIWLMKIWHRTLQETHANHSPPTMVQCACSQYRPTVVGPPAHLPTWASSGMLIMDDRYENGCILWTVPQPCPSPSHLTVRVWLAVAT